MKPQLSKDFVAQLIPIVADLYSTGHRNGLLGALTRVARSGLTAGGASHVGDALSDINKLADMDPVDDSTPLLSFLKAVSLFTRNERTDHEVVLRVLEQLCRQYVTAYTATAWGGSIPAAKLDEFVGGGATLSGMGLASTTSPWANATFADIEAIAAHLRAHQNIEGTVGDAELLPAESPLSSLKLEGLRSGHSRVPANFFDKLLAAKREVCRIHVNASTPTWGTGWMITPKLLITCFHVLGLASVSESQLHSLTAATLTRLASKLLVHFDDSPPTDPEVAPDASGPKYITGHWDPPRLDFAIMELDVPRAGCLKVARDPLELGAREAFVPANIPQYAAGESLVVGIRKNIVEAVSETHIRYTTDTEAGSSGAPVCDDRWVVRALHRRDGNEGTQMSAILKWLAEKRSDVLKRIEAEGHVR